MVLRVLRASRGTRVSGACQGLRVPRANRGLRVFGGRRV